MTTTSFTLTAVAVAPRVPATRRGRVTAPLRRRTVVANAVEIEPDGVLDDMPEGAPALPEEPVVAAQTSVKAPLACPVTLQALDDAGGAVNVAGSAEVWFAPPGSEVLALHNDEVAGGEGRLWGRCCC